MAKVMLRDNGEGKILFYVGPKNLPDEVDAKIVSRGDD